jgi:peptidoglycan/xylan/chitin deacetylase (PgdA/CDA1 family)
MRVPVLTYHAVNIAGNDYATNDHVALAADLRLIGEMGLRVVPLAWVVDEVLGTKQRDLKRCVALTCDDGTDLDFFDIDFPPHGVQRSFYNIMLDASNEPRLAQSGLHLTCFVIASPEAREHLDRECIFGKGWMSERWWKQAARSGRIAIENHSFDHNHASIPLHGISGMRRGSFFPVDNRERADAEIVAAARYIDSVIAPARTALFCYPYGNVNDYLRRDYFPNLQQVHGMRAAFGDGAEPIHDASDRWNLPRYICGHHWKSQDELRTILRAATT